jgi:DNA polymerase III delta prime subunit
MVTFSPSLGALSPERGLAVHDTRQESARDVPDSEQADADTAGRKKRTRGPKGKKGEKVVLNGQGSLENFTRPAKDSDQASLDTVVPTKGLGDDGEPTLEEDPNHGRRKRRKTTSPAPLPESPPIEVSAADTTAVLGWHEQLLLEAEGSSLQGSQGILESKSPGENDQKKAEPRLPPVAPSASFEQEPAPLSSPGLSAGGIPRETTATQTTPKKKMLKVTKRGKLLSSSPVKRDLEPPTTPKRKRGRKSTMAKSSLVVVIKYGSNEASRQIIGQKINSALEIKPVALPSPATPKKSPMRPPGPPKPTHPFFMGKVVQKGDTQSIVTSGDMPATNNAKSPKKTAVTPAKLRAEARSHHVSQANVPSPLKFGAGRATKLPGTVEAPFPTRESAHVRNIESEELLETPLSPQPSNHMLKPKKLKRNAVNISQSEDVIFRLGQQLKRTGVHDQEDLVSDFPQGNSVRLPQRLLTTGDDIQERVLKQIKAPLSLSGEDEDVHPSIKAHFRDIERTLTPFDKGECESQSWVQKYAPVSTTQVLQQGKEAPVLREWLQNLTVMAVQGSKDGALVGGMTESKKPPKKKRRKMDDGFIVDSEDDEDDELIEMFDGEQYGKPDCGSRLRSLRRARMSRNKNVVILSGPHGCGKSATVYAVAKELGFEVFEINSGSRRSGKDILDKVGDMSENHLVNHQRDSAKPSQQHLPIEDADNERMDKAFQKDLESGRQGTMRSFFQSTVQQKAKHEPQLKPKAKPKAPGMTTSTAQAILPISQRPRNQQKQSLILFEEADILFEEDQQFWAQVTKLASQSKRPVVITCNNENLLPVYDLPIGAILRLSPPPVTLAADYLLVLAAKEGHILERKAVIDLYKSRDHDLRASITELDFWCQMSVGDRKGGLEWIYQRWPPGKDVDQNGRVLRVASEGTYQSGMGMISHDVVTGGNTICSDKEELLLKEVWADWGISPDNWNGPEEQSDGRIPNPSTSMTRLEELSRIDSMLEAVSCADVYSRVSLPSYDRYYDEPTDPSLPPISEKELLNFTADAPLLQVDHTLDFGALDMDMAIQSHLSVKRSFPDCQALHKSLDLVPTFTSEDEVVQLILQHKANQQKQQRLSRPDFSTAFDLLASPPGAILPAATSYQLTASSFDRTFKIVAEDLAPYVRSIVSHELRLEAQRIRLSSFLSEGGRSKRQRTTRASRVALEGGTRQSKRRERWFDKGLNRDLVMTTAGNSWSGMGSMTDETDMSSKTGESLPGSQGE